MPPEVPAAAVHRDVLLLLDTSGSMGGAPMAQLKAFCRAIIDGLDAADRLEMIEFSRRPSRWSKQPVAMRAGAKAKALSWVDGLSASGGTHMHEAVMAATATLRAEAARQVVLVTDGLIGFESQILGHLMAELPAGCRFHTVGIGHAPNRTLTGGVARAGGGFEAIVAPAEPVGPVVAELLARTEARQISAWQVEGARTIAPAKLPDLMAGAPTRIHLELDGNPVVLRGRTAEGAWSKHVEATEGERRVVATRFARERVADLELEASAGALVDAQIEALGLAHRIATRLTSWVAVRQHATVDPGAPTRHETVPQALPAGMSAEGVGLRRALPPLGNARPMMAALAAPPPLASAPARSRRHMSPAPQRGAERDTGRRAGRPRKAKRQEAERTPWLQRAKRAMGLGRRVVKARLRQVGKRWVIEVDGPLDWDATGELTATLSDGTVVRQPAEVGTTAPGPIAAGTTARLVLALPEAPVRVTLGALELEF